MKNKSYCDKISKKESKKEQKKNGSDIFLGNMEKIKNKSKSYKKK